MGAKILLYHCGDEKTKKIRNAASAMGVLVISLKEGELGKKLGALAGIEGVDNGEETIQAPVPQTELLVMSEFSDKQFELLINMSKRGKIPRISLKAVITETNMNWTLEKLISELTAEYEYMHQKKNNSLKTKHRK